MLGSRPRHACDASIAALRDLNVLQRIANRPLYRDVNDVPEADGFNGDMPIEYLNLKRGDDGTLPISSRCNRRRILF